MKLVASMAEGVGFEPTGRLNTDQTISSRSRYDHFDTSPLIRQPFLPTRILYHIREEKSRGFPKKIVFPENTCFFLRNMLYYM